MSFTTPTFIANLSDPILKVDLTNAYSANGVITQANLAVLFPKLATEVGNGTLSASQVEDLKTIANNINAVDGNNAYVTYITQRKFPEIDNGVPYYAKQDRTHEISLVAIYDINKKWSISAVWVFYTGNAVTWPSGSYTIGNIVVPQYTQRNGYRMPDYHRLDIGATVQLKKHKRWDHNLNMSLYNVYGRRNAYAINFQQDPNNPSQNQAVQLTLFRWVPSITYNFKFL